MRNAVFIGAASILGAALYVVTRPAGESSEEIPEAGALDGIDAWLDSWTGGVLKLSAMAQVTASMINNPNVQAFLRVIRRGEGTSDDAGYRRIFGGQIFSSFADHPRITVNKSGYRSTAAGAYQFKEATWDETRRIMGLGDFSPASQDAAAVGRIAARGALADVIAGRLAQAIQKCCLEWASLPGSPYGQPTISLTAAAATYAGAGGRSYA